MMLLAHLVKVIKKSVEKFIQETHPVIHYNALIWRRRGFVAFVLCERVRRHEGLACLGHTPYISIIGR